MQFNVLAEMWFSRNNSSLSMNS